jgi:hypothetical protein
MSNHAPPLVYLSDELAQTTAGLLDSFAQRRPSEGVVYWFGIDQGRTAVVTTLIVPDADTTGGLVRTSARQRRRDWRHRRNSARLHRTDALTSWSPRGALAHRRQ